MVEACVSVAFRPASGAARIVSDFGSSADAKDVALAQEGDVAAFERLYRNNLGRVYGLCLRMVADPSRAEELAQETFIRAWQKLGTFRGDSKFSSWLHRLAVIVVLSRQRSRRRREARVIAVEDPEVHQSEPAPSPPQGRVVDLEKAVAELPEGARRVFLLHDVEGFSHIEVAEMVGIAVGTSKAHLHRARKLLRKALDK